MVGDNNQDLKFAIQTKPDVIFVGYPKTGSTYLRSYFQKHPDVSFTQIGGEGASATTDGELYFTIDEKFKSPDWVFAKEDIALNPKRCVVHSDGLLSMGAVLEKDMEYTGERLWMTPYSSMGEDQFYSDPREIADRIKQTVPDVRIIITIRNQIDWLRSHYLEYIRVAGVKDRRFNTFVNTLYGKMALYSGCFDHVISTYIGLFGRENVHVNLLEQWGNADEDPLRSLCEFMGVPFVPHSPSEKDFHRSQTLPSANWLKLASKLGIPPETSSKLGPLYAPFKGLIRRALSGDVLSPSDKSFINSAYAASNYNTGKLLNIDLRQYGYAL